jgi:hypothetical protein
MANENFVLDSMNALPNKLIQNDSTITDITGAPVTETISAYDSKPALPNKFLNPDGTYSTLNEIIASMVDTDIFIPVQTLPETGESNKIYLVPNGEGTFDEYYYNENGQWDPIGVLDISNLATTDDIAKCLADAKTYADQEIAKVVPMITFSEYPSIVTDGTTAQFLNSIQALNLATGTILLGATKLTDIDDVANGMKNEEQKVEIYPNNVLHCTMTSSDVKPYEWTIQWYTKTESWIPRVLLSDIENSVSEQVTEKLGGSY